MGGSDTYGLTPQIIEVLSDRIGSIDVTVVVGPAFKHEEELRAAMSGREGSVRLLRAIGIESMRTWIGWADCAVCAAGNTLFEMACCGTPVVVVCNEPFEEETAFRFERQGFGSVLPFSTRVDRPHLLRLLRELSSRTVRETQSRRGKELVDGLGIQRIAEAVIDRVAAQRTGAAP